MKARILRFYGTEIVARYYLDLGKISVKDAKNLIDKIVQLDSDDKYLTSSEYELSYIDKFGYKVTFEKELLLPQNIKRCNENLEKIWSSLNYIKDHNHSKNLKIELYKKLI